jgi:hypothetical protein
MKKLFGKIVVGVAAILVFSSSAGAQGAGAANTLYNRLDIGSGGPAPKRELTGSWTGPLDARIGAVPPMTPLGQKMFAANKPESKFHLTGTNDPFRTCDPFGMPRSDMNELRGIGFAVANDRVIILNQYQRTWREVWTDGRPLPENIGTRKGPDTRYYGYSVGHWEDDYTFVVDTTGLDESTWINSGGYPHSSSAHVQERFHRIDHNNLQVVVTIDDPKIYTQPFTLTTNNYKWIPDQQLEEQLCIPSQMLDYVNIIGAPADGAPAQ